MSYNLFIGRLVELWQVARVKRYDRLHRFDNISSMPRELFEKAMDIPGIHRTVVILNMLDEIREAVKTEIAQRVHANGTALPERLQSREGEVAEAITAFVAHNGYLAG